MDVESILARVDRRLEAMGLSQDKASSLAHKPDSIRNLRRAIDEGRNPDVKIGTINAWAPVLGTTAVWLLAEAGPEVPGVSVPAKIAASEAISAPRIVSASYGGTVEAGSWREVDWLDDETAKPPRPEAIDAEFPNARMYFFDVAGDSMNDLRPRPIMPGDQVVALDFEDLGSRVPLRDGMVVIVEQTKEGGMRRERSVKQIEMYRDRTEFCPRSTNPRHKPIVVPYETEMGVEDTDGRMVRILGWVRRVTNDVPGW